MKLRMMLTMALGVFSLALVPAVGMADGPDYQPGGPNYQPGQPGHQQEHQPQGPKSAPKGNAYGYYCRGESKKHVKGEQGTAFSLCVRAHKRAANQPDLTPKQACRDLKGQKHIAHGDKGTPFSRCVKTVAQQRKEEAATVASGSAV
jgi:hypothetical protein